MSHDLLLQSLDSLANRSLEQLLILSILWGRDHCNQDIDIALLPENFLYRPISKVVPWRWLPYHSMALCQQPGIRVSMHTSAEGLET